MSIFLYRITIISIIPPFICLLTSNLCLRVLERSTTFCHPSFLLRLRPFRWARSSWATGAASTWTRCWGSGRPSRWPPAETRETPGGAPRRWQPPQMELQRRTRWAVNRRYTLYKEHLKLFLVQIINEVVWTSQSEWNSKPEDDVDLLL